MSISKAAENLIGKAQEGKDLCREEIISTPHSSARVLT